MTPHSCWYTRQTMSYFILTTWVSFHVLPTLMGKIWPFIIKMKQWPVLTFNKGIQKNPLWDFKEFNTVWPEEGFTHNQNMISTHRDDCPVHCAEQLDHDLLDVVIGEGLQCSEKHYCYNMTLSQLPLSKTQTGVTTHRSCTSQISWFHQAKTEFVYTWVSTGHPYNLPRFKGGRDGQTLSWLLYFYNSFCWHHFL